MNVLHFQHFVKGEIMKNVKGFIFMSIQLLLLLGLVTLAQANNDLKYPKHVKPLQIDKSDTGIKGVIVLLAGSDDKNSPFYEPDFFAAINKDFRQLLISARALMLNDDFEQIIIGLDKILLLNDSREMSKNTLAKYLKHIME
jgi:hypothetical protein